MAQVARASVTQFQQLMAEITPVDAGYNDPVFAREVVLELRSMLNKEHKRAGEAVLPVQHMQEPVGKVLCPHMAAVAAGRSPAYEAMPPEMKAREWVAIVGAALNRTASRA